MKIKGKQILRMFIVAVFSMGILAACNSQPKVDSSDANTKQETTDDGNKETVENQTITVAIGESSRGGVYSGEVVNGKPEGKGRFDSKNSLGEVWYYEGMWKEGQFNGNGSCVWENGQIKEGIYENGIWTPTQFGFYQYILSLTEYGIDTKAKELINERPELFPVNTDVEVKALVDSKLTGAMVMEATENYGDKIMAIPNAYVAQVEQLKLEETGQPYTFMIVVDENDMIYEFYFIGELKEEIKAADVLKVVYGLPLGKSLYPNISGSVSKSLSMAGSYYEK